MAKNKGKAPENAAAPLEAALEASRKERAAKMAQDMLGTKPQKLAQEMLGKHRRSSTPRAAVGPGPVASTLASRVGITKRSNSVPRPASTQPYNTRQPSHLSRPPITSNHRPRDTPRDRRDAPRDAITISSDSVSQAKSNGYAEREVVDDSAGLSIRGAAGGPYIVQAQNFALGTTSADIESVMQSVGGNMNYCRIVTSAPTVIAQMSFVDKAGADAVIKMFNNKKADGRTLHVFMQYDNTGGTRPTNGGAVEEPMVVEDEPLTTIVDTVGDTTMTEVDNHAEARAVEDRQREERRREPREPREREREREREYEREREREPRDAAYPTGPAHRQQNDYPRRAEPAYQDGRYGFGGRDPRYGGGGGRGGGGYRGQGGMYSDRMGRGGGAQGYRS
ncbi:hypothetical protein LTR53_001894 [Teratosphaeriaceae sp. CCFEE 6253]|nr:hypothetical protein LTR53_001894 [Teratosphaeriaceae sp. CCFEE 6253]